MSKAPIAFIDHPFHRKTRSSNFFIDLLHRELGVDLYYADRDPRALMQEIADRGYETVVCWQTEFCAPYFLMRGLRVVCVPMYDGVANVPDWYWRSMQQARFICFSEALHRRLRSLGIESWSFRYYSASMASVPQATFEQLRGFFWQRRPEEGLHWRFARNLLGQSIRSLHIHNAPDTAEPGDWQPDYLCTTSYFTEDGAAYRDALAHANVFVCSRYTEGIGMAMVEALARGMCVVAHDAPTANEYITDGVNGLLIDFRNDRESKERLSRLDLTTAMKLGKAARESFLRGLRQWEEDSAHIAFLVRTAPLADLRDGEKRFASEYLNICRYFFNHFDLYLRGLYRLYRKGMTGEEASAIRLRERAIWRLKRIPGARLTWKIVRRAHSISTSGSLKW